MLLEKIKTPGLAHLSYVIGAEGEAAVIDPRRDCETYVEIAREHGMEITHIFETHRNEDLISGAPILSAWTGAKVFHGPNPDGPIDYASTARDGDRFAIGSLVIEVKETPGHTDDHLAFAVYDDNYDDGAVAVFTGDALFVGDVGRTDFYPDRAEEVAGLLYDSLQKILNLGDQAILYPAHGAGSVCGSGMAAREFSTLGHERKNNPRLQIGDRDRFIQKKITEIHYKPPYFSLMERLNAEGAQPADRIMAPKPLTLPEFKAVDADHVIDIRDPTAFAAGFLPGSVCIPVSMIPAFAGWFVGEGETMALVAEQQEDLRQAMVHLSRIGLDNVVGGLTGIVDAIAQGEAFESLPMVATDTVADRLESGDNSWTLLDVRAADEVEQGSIDKAEHIYAGHLNEQWRDLDRQRPYTVMCASGMRATIAASWLASKGFEKLDVYLGSMGAWKAAH